MTKPPPDSYLRKFNERVCQHIHEQNVEKFLREEMGDDPIQSAT